MFDNLNESKGTSSKYSNVEKSENQIKNLNSDSDVNFWL